jgi:hypothetical protein
MGLFSSGLLRLKALDAVIEQNRKFGVTEPTALVYSRETLVRSKLSRIFFVRFFCHDERNATATAG